MDQYRRSEVNPGDVIGYFDILDRRRIKGFTYKICNCINVARITNDYVFVLFKKSFFTYYE